MLDIWFGFLYKILCFQREKFIWGFALNDTSPFVWEFGCNTREKAKVIQYTGSGRPGERKGSQPWARKPQKSKEMSWSGSCPLRGQEQLQQCHLLWLYQCPPPLALSVFGEDMAVQPLQLKCGDQCVNAGKPQLNSEPQWNKTCFQFFPLNPCHPGLWVCVFFGFTVQKKCQKSCWVSGLASTKVLSILVCLVHMGCRRRALLLSLLPVSQTSTVPLPSLFCCSRILLDFQKEVDF